jgi:bis(5'-nucleosidyl)-tetraphosphatase
MKVKTLSVGVVIARKTAHGCCYLLLRVYQYRDFPKGIVEPGEDAFVAACREWLLNAQPTN